MTSRPIRACAGAALLAFGLAVPVAGQAPEVDGARALQHVEQLVEIGPRPAGSPAIRQTRAYITRQLAAVGLAVQEQPFTVTTPIGRVEMVNLVVRLPGARSDRILIAGHYDTKLMREASFVGANDGGSSAALLLELARVLATHKREFTYELLWLDGEEAFCREWSECGTPGAPDNTYGSRHYVEAARRAGALASIRALVLVDMVGDADLRIQRDTNSTPWLVDLVWDEAKQLGHGSVFVDDLLAVEDDHIPFLRAGIPSIDIIDLDYPAWHTPADTLDRVSAESLQRVGEVIVRTLPAIERRLLE